jgi:hypothetical protein
MKPRGRAPFLDNTPLVSAGILALVAALIGLLVLANRSTALAPDFLAEFVLYALVATDLTILVALGFVLTRNIVKLVVERRRALPVARFRAKIVAALLAMTVVPALLVLLVGGELIRSSVARWFDAPMGEVLASANSIAADYYRLRQDGLAARSSRLARMLAADPHALSDAAAAQHVVTLEAVPGSAAEVRVYRAAAAGSGAGLAKLAGADEAGGTKPAAYELAGRLWNHAPAMFTVPAGGIDDKPSTDVADIKTDWVGMGLLVLAVGALQYVLDQGQTREWFHSKAIVAGTIIAVFAGAAFFIRGWNKSDNIIDLSLLRDRNFAAGTLAMTAYGISLLGWMAIMPLFSQRLLGYSPATAGTLFIPRGLVSAITLAITGGILIRMFDARHLVIAGLVMTALGTLPMAYFSLYVDYWGIATPGMIAGIGSGLFFVPLTAVAFASIPKAQYDEAAGVYALMRGIGASAGIAIVSWLFVRQTQIHFNELTAHITPYNSDIVPYLGQHGLKPYSPEAAPLIVHEIARQAQMLAFNDIFWFIAMVTLCIIPLIFVMKRPEKVSLVPA